MSSPIGSVSQLVTVIRSELGKVAIAHAAGERRGRKSAVGASRYASQHLPALIAVRIRHIGRDDPQRGRKAFRVFLEVVLLSQFGEQMVSDPKFYQMLDDVQQAMELDSACGLLVDEAIIQLLAQSN